MPFDQISIDFETGGTTADCAVLSLGAVKFDLASGEIHGQAFYQKVSLESNEEWGRVWSPSTLRWWMNQGDAARKELFPPGNNLKPEQLGGTIEELLNNFTHYCSDLKHPNYYYVWGNGSDFDNAILQHMYRQARIEPPWPFWNNRCLRTLKNLPAAKAVKIDRVGTHHNALDDAIHQAKLAAAIWAALNGTNGAKAAKK